MYAASQLLPLALGIVRAAVNVDGWPAARINLFWNGCRSIIHTYTAESTRDLHGTFDMVRLEAAHLRAHPQAFAMAPVRSFTGVGAIGKPTSSSICGVAP